MPEACLRILLAKDVEKRDGLVLLGPSYFREWTLLPPNNRPVPPDCFAKSLLTGAAQMILVPVCFDQNRRRRLSLYLDHHLVPHPCGYILSITKASGAISKASVISWTEEIVTEEMATLTADFFAVRLHLSKQNSLVLLKYVDISFENLIYNKRKLFIILEIVPSSSKVSRTCKLTHNVVGISISGWNSFKT